MFTGIVEDVGRVRETGPGRLAIESVLTEGLEIGGSVAVNGCCLTAVRIEVGAFWADLVPETLSRTNLGLLGAGDEVNLELPATATTALDGHLVQGHVDGCVSVIARSAKESGARVRLALPASLARYVAEKGSVAVDGISLTVAAVDEASFSVALIPHTLERTVAGRYEAGTQVNLEVDVIARYTERLLASRTHADL
jgi:riboflavin synthase